MKTPTTEMAGSGLPLWLAVGHFILRAPARLARTELPVFLARVAAQPRDGSNFRRVRPPRSPLAPPAAAAFAQHVLFAVAGAVPICESPRRGSFPAFWGG